MNDDAHELIEALRQEGLQPQRTLVEMLGEDPGHCTERRGCGYTQATRFLATYINQPRRVDTAEDLGVFAGWPQAETEALARRALAAGWRHGWRMLDRASPALLETLGGNAIVEALRSLPPRLQAACARLRNEESRILLRMLVELLDGDSEAAASMPEVAGMPVKPEIGSCSQAEEFFLEIAHGRVRRHGTVNSILDARGNVLMLEKMNLGESHSAIVIAPIRINAVVIPPGGLCALRYVESPPPDCASLHGRAVPLAAIAEARFLRLTTLSAPPEHRRRAFAAQVEAQLRARMVSPLSTTLEDLRRFAEAEIVRAA